MPKNKSLIILPFLIPSVVCAQWFQVGNVSTSFLYDVKFLNENTGVVGSTNGIWRTTTGGTNWIQVWPTFDVNSLYFINILTGYGCGGGRVFKTTDGGLSWNEYILTSGLQGVRSISFFNSNTGVCVGTYGIVNRTTNAGIVWYRQDSVYSQELLSVSVLNSGVGWIAGGAPFELVKKTTNYGASWQVTGNLGTSGLNGVWTVNDNLAFVCGHFGTIRRTTNGGVNWIKLDSLTSRNLRKINFIDVNTGFVVGDYGTIMNTPTSGINWYIQSSGTTNNLYGVSFINTYTGWAVGSGGIVLKTTNGGITSVKNLSDEVPRQYHLYRNYPNPFNPITTIRFDILKNALASIIIYNALGKEIEVLLPLTRLPAGTYQINWNGGSCSGGVYYCMLTADAFIETNKMVLVR